MKKVKIGTCEKKKIKYKSKRFLLKPKTKKIQESKIILIVVVIIILIFLIELVFRISKKLVFNKNIYNNILPRISFSQKSILSLSEIFNSRILYINESYLTKD